LHLLLFNKENFFILPTSQWNTMPQFVACPTQANMYLCLHARIWAHGNWLSILTKILIWSGLKFSFPLSWNIFS